MAKTRLPAFMLKHTGFLGLDISDVEMPRLKLLQGSSPEIDEFDNANEGEFWHCMTNERLGPTVRICPVYIDSRFVLWRPRQTGGGILARADDGRHWTPADTEFVVRLASGRDVTWRTARTVKASGLDKRGSSDPCDANSPPAATRMYAIACAFPDRQDLPPAVAILHGESTKTATKLIRELKDLRAPSFGVILEMAVSTEKPAPGGLYNYTFSVDGPVEDRSVYEDNFAQYRFFMEQGLQVKDLEGAQGDETN